MPPLAEVKIIDYDEDGWTAKRTETMAKIQDIVRPDALSSRATLP
jgi:hypothetical protein